MPDGNYLLIPGVSSERRKYIPFGFISPEIMASNLVNISQNAEPYHFGLLSSTLTMPAELTKAHTVLDRAVDKCYRPQPFINELNRMQFLFALYEELTEVGS
ncbi:MAG: hypothetical protein D3903_01920 [Candidatus Electrothrix sp. GM3_4]|nr:hypothetical protein [Candidatus Electrothrix sp. GM3_4]